MYMVTPATEASMMSIGHFSEIFDPGKNGLQLFDDSLMRLMNELASNDPNVVSSYVPFQDDDMERPVEMSSFEMFLLQNVNVKGKVIITADTRHLQRWAAKLIPCCAVGILLSSVFVLRYWKVCVSVHTSALPVVHGMRKIWNQSNLRASSVRSPKTIT